jgi:hypothetical protein
MAAGDMSGTWRRSEGVDQGDDRVMSKAKWAKKQSSKLRSVTAGPTRQRVW